MCGRFFRKQKQGYAGDLDGLGDVLRQLAVQGDQTNIAPSSSIWAIGRKAGGSLGLSPLRWGLIPYWWRDAAMPGKSFNARLEEAADKPMWRRAVTRGRCLIPASGWIEWQPDDKRKQPWQITLPGGEGMMFAGLYDRWVSAEGETPVFSAAICTTSALPVLADLHPRMPVVLKPEAWGAWLDPANDIRSLAGSVVSLYEREAVERGVNRVEESADLFSAAPRRSAS
ncbi:SOS response-associated peptidase [Lacibacterium aquatile]|uniref:Abasic site processing protein n=1 Tax=Lacibacterium aquatile TaxID=1168082 RepID=A0ABW5DVI1_9PROT